MLNMFKRAGIVAALAVGAMTFAPTAEARDRYYRHRGGDDAAIAIGAGAIGLALGAAVASNRRDGYYDRDYYDRDYYDRGYYYDLSRRYHYPRYRHNRAYPRGYYYGAYPPGYGGRWDRGYRGWDRGYDRGRYRGWGY